MQLTVTWAGVRRVLVGLFAAAALVGLGWAAAGALRPPDPFGGRVAPDRYQAVFLAGSGEVYFGHLRAPGGAFYELRDAFFLAEAPDEEEGDPPTQQVRRVSADFHGPTGTMLLAREAVVRVENLRPDSEVALAIDRVLEAEE